MIFAAVAETYPARVAGLMRDLTQPPHRPASGRMHTIIGPTYVMLGVSFALARLGMAAVRAIRRVKR